MKVSLFSFVALSALLAGTARAKLADGLVVYLDFDDNTANAAPGSPYGTTVVGVKAAPRYAEGRFGRAADFRGGPANAAEVSGSSAAADTTVTSDWAVILPPELSNVYAGDWSVSLWVRTNSIADGAIMGNKNWVSGSNPGWALSTVGSGGRVNQGDFNWAVTGGSRHDARFAAERKFTDNTWHHVVATFSRSTDEIAVYLDDVRINLKSANTFGGTDAHSVLGEGLATAIGGTRHGTSGITAVVDDVAIWNRVLKPNEITALNRYAAKDVPEPGAYGLAGAGALGLVAMIRRRRRR